MIWLYGIAAVLLLVKMLMIPTLPAVPTIPIVETLVNQSAIPNAVTAVILRNRLYDTIFEVVVFTLAIMGAQYLLSNEKPLGHVSRFNDQPSIVLARFGATICSLVCIELALRGHLSPGGGFAAGVAGGTAIGLVAITSAPEWLESIYRRFHAATWEKISVIVFILCGASLLMGAALPAGRFGTLLSGGWIPWLNILIALKVALGSWAAVLTFIRYRGLL
ncbi:Na(+)/H(+) antiporter subunit B [Thermosynechococcus sichuanensis E542]|uniref:Na(+)/H(+) antiporter subunit B n=1 Tax=Thermosynechococcus sichuanensis E542 TaxID=2016101 RepID=A0A3B7MFK2_9CYAN|nr:Na(+)/H(+) antiporter subunit B [Thermosynechococcus vestitus]AXY68408.1 Na(+)/H(+) antiporter subunit B [Thermosynechococcus vestitus E542]